MQRLVHRFAQLVEIKRLVDDAARSQLPSSQVRRLIAKRGNQDDRYSLQLSVELGEYVERC